MSIRKTLAVTLITFLFINSLCHASSQLQNDNNGLEHSKSAAPTFNWDNTDKASTDRIFGLESPSADDLENIFCAVHVTGVNPVERNYVLTPGSAHNPFGQVSRFVQLTDDSFRPFVYFTLGDSVKDHKDGAWSHKKYAIITRFSNLVGRALNISPLDTAVLGEVDLKTLPGSIVLMPQLQADKIKLSPDNVTLIGYSEQTGILDAVKTYLTSKQQMILREESGQFSFGQKVFVGNKNIYTPAFFRHLLTRYNAASFGQESAPKLARGMHNFAFLSEVMTLARHFYVDRIDMKVSEGNNFNFGKPFQLQPLIACTEIALEHCDALVRELGEESGRLNNVSRIDQMSSAAKVYHEHRARVTTILRTMKLDAHARKLFQIIFSDIGIYIEPRCLDSFCDFDGNSSINWDDENTRLAFLKEFSRNYGNRAFHFDATHEHGFFPFDTVLTLLDYYPFSDVKRILKNKHFVEYELELKAVIAFRQLVRKLYGQEAIDSTNLIQELKTCYNDLREKYFMSRKDSKYYALDPKNLKSITFNGPGEVSYLPLEKGHMGLANLLKALSTPLLACKGDQNRRHSEDQVTKLRSFLSKSGFEHILVQFECVGFITRNLEIIRIFEIQKNLSDVLDHKGQQIFPANLWKKRRQYITQVESLADPWA